MNRDSEIFTIHVVINGVRMPLNIPRDQEEIYRNAERMVNKSLEEFSKKYSQRSIEQILTYVTYKFAVMVSKRDLFDTTDPLTEKIEALNNEIEEQLK